MRRVLAQRDARLCIAGQTLSALGDNALWLAMGIWVKILTGSSSAAGFVFFAFAAGSLTAPLTGWLVDRVRRRPLLIAANLAAGAGVCALLLARAPGLVWLVYPVMFGYGVMDSLIGSAQTALMAVLLPVDLLGEANSALQVGRQGLRVISPLLGAGLLAAVGPAPVVLADAGTFAAAACATAALRLREPAPARSSARWWPEAAAGVRHIARTPALRRLTGAGLIAMSVFGFFETIPYAVVGQALHRPPAFLGVLMSVMGAGAICGGFAAGPLMRRIGEAGLVSLGLAACGAGSLALIIPALPAALAATALLGICLAWANIGINTLIQTRTPPVLLGRVDSALFVTLTAPQTASIALGAALLAVVDYRVLLAGMAAVIFAAAVFLAADRGLRRPAPARAAGEAAAPDPAADRGGGAASI